MYLTVKRSDILSNLAHARIPQTYGIEGESQHFPAEISRCQTSLQVLHDILQCQSLHASSKIVSANRNAACQLPSERLSSGGRSVVKKVQAHVLLHRGQELVRIRRCCSHSRSCLHGSQPFANAAAARRAYVEPTKLRACNCEPLCERKYR